MLGELTEVQIEDLLTKQVIGRIGCHDKGITYIVPINYVYKENCIYGHSSEGKKMRMLRNNPQVCFQVDDIQSITDWKSVIVWGEYTQITEKKEMQQAMQHMVNHIMSHTTDENAHPSHGITESESDIGTTVELILYKICLHTKTGRYEKSR